MSRIAKWTFVWAIFHCWNQISLRWLISQVRKQEIFTDDYIRRIWRIYPYIVLMEKLSCADKMAWRSPMPEKFAVTRPDYGWTLKNQQPFEVIKRLSLWWILSKHNTHLTNSFLNLIDHSKSKTRSRAQFISVLPTTWHGFIQLFRVFLYRSSRTFGVRRSCTTTTKFDKVVLYQTYPWFAWSFFPAKKNAW